MSNFFSKIKSVKNPLVNILKESFEDYSNNKFNPVNLYVKIKETLPVYNNIDQHDANEFMVNLLDYLHENIPQCFDKHRIQFANDAAKESWGNRMNIISEIMQGQYHITIDCSQCNHKITTFETFIQLEIPYKGNLETAFKAFANAEVLDGYICDACKESGTSQKKTDICIFPLTLIFVIKRNNEPNETSFQTKLTINKVVYELYCVCNHMGTLDMGHYSTTLFNKDKWYLINDDFVKEIQYPNFAHAYILFYKFVSHDI
jgi:ubiquitin C-terminal hydrolase